MDRAGDRFEILRVERERINVAVPADDIERIMRHRHAGPARAIFHQNLGVFFFVDRVELGRPVKIALGIRRAHFDLAFLIQIAFRNSHRPDRFENQIIFLFNLVRNEPVSDSARNHDVIFGAITLLSENRFNRAAAFEDEDDLIGAAVFVILKLVRRPFPVGTPRRHVLIEQESERGRCRDRRGAASSRFSNDDDAADSRPLSSAPRI